MKNALITDFILRSTFCLSFCFSTMSCTASKSSPESSSKETPIEQDQSKKDNSRENTDPSPITPFINDRIKPTFSFNQSTQELLYGTWEDTDLKNNETNSCVRLRMIFSPLNAVDIEGDIYNDSKCLNFIETRKFGNGVFYLSEIIQNQANQPNQPNKIEDLRYYDMFLLSIPGGTPGPSYGSARLDIVGGNLFLSTNSGDPINRPNNFFEQRVLHKISNSYNRDSSSLTKRESFINFSSSR